MRTFTKKHESSMTLDQQDNVVLLSVVGLDILRLFLNNNMSIVTSTTTIFTIIL